MQKYYKAEMDRWLRISTRLVWLVFFVPPGIMVYSWYKSTNPPAVILTWGLPVCTALMAIAAYITKAMAPKGYAVNDMELLIDRDMRPITIPLRDIQEARLLEDGALRYSARLMGTSGFYGYYGLYWNKKLGKFRAYATRFNRLVAVKTEKKLFVISPDTPEDFVETLRGLLRR